MFDSHAHYNDEKFNSDREELLDRLFAEGLTGFLNSASDERSSEAALEIVHNRSGAFCSAGVHPHEASKVTSGWERRIESLLNEDKCVALGEIGLDYHYDFSPREVQKEVFRTQMAIFGEKLEEEISQGLEMATAKGSVESLLDLLPEVFDKSDLIALRVKRKQSTTKQSIGTILLRWKKAGKIEQVEGLAKYRQLKKN